MNDELQNAAFVRACIDIMEWYIPSGEGITLGRQLEQCKLDAEKGDERAIKFFVRYTAELLKG